MWSPSPDLRSAAGSLASTVALRTWITASQVAKFLSETLTDLVRCFAVAWGDDELKATNNMRISERLDEAEEGAELFDELLAQARTGDAEALDRMIRRYYEAVRAAVHQQLAIDLRASRPWLTSRFSTGDIVQEVFESVLTDLGAFRGHSEDAFCGYLAMIVRNRIIDAIRYHQAGCRDGRLSLELQELADHGGPEDPAKAASDVESAKLVLSALSQLDEPTRLLVRARLEGTASFAELASQLGYGSDSSARRAFFDAQAKLAIHLRELRGVETKEPR